jgi:hypothetical protein
MNLFVMCCGGIHSRPWKGNCIYWLIFNNSASPCTTVEDTCLLGALRGCGQRCAPLTPPNYQSMLYSILWSCRWEELHCLPCQPRVYKAMNDILLLCISTWTPKLYFTPRIFVVDSALLMKLGIKLWEA